MRAFLREPSTPWIVFDQDVRPKSQLAVGEVLPVALSSVIPEHGFFPATAIIDAQHHAAAVEPSSLAVAADLTDETPDLTLESASLPMRRLSRRVLGAGVAGLAMLAVLAVGVVALSATPTSEGPTAAANGAPMPADLPPPDLDVKIPAAAPAPVPVVTATPAPEDRPLAKRFGRLSITGDARGRDVFLDGKRLLGRGTRTFTVTCGSHSIAVGNRADARDMDVPCNAELVLSK